MDALADWPAVRHQHLPVGGLDNLGLEVCVEEAVGLTAFLPVYRWLVRAGNRYSAPPALVVSD